MELPPTWLLTFTFCHTVGIHSSWSIYLICICSKVSVMIELRASETSLLHWFSYLQHTYHGNGSHIVTYNFLCSLVKRIVAREVRITCMVSTDEMAYLILINWTVICWQAMSLWSTKVITRFFLPIYAVIIVILSIGSNFAFFLLF